MTYAGPPQQPLQFLPPYPPIQKKVRKVGAPLGVLILLGTIAGLIVIALTAFNPVGTSIGFVLSSIAMTVVVLAYLWLDRWEPEPPRLLVLAFLWGASVAVIVASILQLVAEAAINPGATEGASPVTVVLGAPLTEEAAKGLFLLLMMTGRRRNELNSLTDCLVYAGLVGAGFAWLEDILYIGGGETVGDSLVTAAMRLIMAPFAHSLFTTFFGIGVWYALHRRDALAKAGCILLGYLGAVIMHALWNGSSLLGIEAYFGVYFLWMVPIFALIIWLSIASRRKEQRITAGKLPGMVAAGLVTPNEATWLGSIKARKAAIGHAGRTGGKAAAKSVKTFAYQVVELAFVRDRIDRGFGDERVHALLHEETYAVYGARANAPALAGLVAFRT
ncbi:PrsW family intramembrane metalloprotease [Mycolicibacterium sp. 120270]|uniref:PrsW family intramembrane metalloprotease n=1 Tax=Mycolicibacterium sp. 120270 TaxID=3090600 RepID=UPI00299CED7B|nr:PrsW family intramembrane metalloprotease [Mycolicibacterium sp. 120270]MDX1886124.1 PrsW family intramembrane metalloprotease [Mycolicibacterium sp. 120270]